MPFGSAKDKRDIAAVVSFLVGLLLLMGSIPFLNFTAATPVFGPITVGVLLGLLSIYNGYVLWKSRGF